VSIVTPAYNASAFINECIESVLKQTYSCIEHIIVDDGSIDETESICKHYAGQNLNISFFQHEGGKRQGVSASRELSIKQAQGEYIAFLDADDIFLPNKIASQVKAMQEHPDVILVHGSVKGFGADKVFCNSLEKWMNFCIKPTVYQLLNQVYAFSENRIANSTVMVRAYEINKVKIPRLKFQFEDWATWLMLARQGSFLFLPEVVTLYRSHEKSFTGSLRKAFYLKHFARLEFYFELWTKRFFFKNYINRRKIGLLIIQEFCALFKNLNVQIKKRIC